MRSGRAAVLPLAAAAAIALVTALAAQAARPVSKSQYEAMLAKANSEATKAETSIQQALTSSSVTVADLKARGLALAATLAKFGNQFASVTPPDAAARKANALLVRGERHFAVEVRALIQRLPRTKSAAAAYIFKLVSQPPKGVAEIERALAQLKAAGYRTP